MYSSKHYFKLSEMSVYDLQLEMKSAYDRLDAYQQYGNSVGSSIHVMLRGVQSCEAYIVEIQRRLGMYNQEVCAMLVRKKFKSFQSRGVTLSALCQVSDLEADTSEWYNVFGVKRYKKFNFKEVKRA